MRLSTFRYAALLLTPGIFGCSLTTTMVPIKGPLSEQRPLHTIKVKVKGIMNESGKLSFKMPNGEACEGRWTSLAYGDAVSSQGSLLTEYGEEKFSSLTSGRPGQALAVCDSGRTVQVEFATTGTLSPHGVGVAKDSEGNIYRFVF